MTQGTEGDRMGMADGDRKTALLGDADSTFELLEYGGFGLGIVDKDIPGDIRIMVRVGDLAQDGFAGGAAVDKDKTFFAQHAVELLHRFVVRGKDAAGMVVDKPCLGEEVPDLIDPFLNSGRTETGKKHPFHPVHCCAAGLHGQMHHVVSGVSGQLVAGGRELGRGEDRRGDVPGESQERLKLLFVGDIIDNDCQPGSDFFCGSGDG